MTRYLRDTNAMGDWINKRFGVHLRANEARSRGAVVGTCEIVVGELFFGVENSSTRELNIERLQRALSGLKCWPLTREASRDFGRIMARMHREGNKIGRMDVLIAAIGLSLPDCIVVSKDSDMLRIPDLNVENWAAPAE